MCSVCPLRFLFFFNDTATTEIYTLSLHDALPICPGWWNKRNKFCTTYNRKELLLRVVCRLFQLFDRQGHQTAWAARDFSLRLTRSGNSVLVRQGVSDATGVLSMVPDITADAARR